MKINNDIQLKGIFKINIFKNGKLIEEYVDKNTVVNSGREAITKLLGNDGISKYILSIGVGTSNIVPSVSDTSLTDSFIKPLSTTSYPDSTSIKFTFDIGTSEANPKSIREFGLLCSDGTLFARKTRTVIEKDVDISISGEWTITLS